MVLPFFLVFTLSLGAYCTAQTKLDTTVELKTLKLGITQKQLERIVGTPSGKVDNELTYVFEDGSDLKVTMTKGYLSSAVMNYKKPTLIPEPEKLVFLNVNSKLDDHQDWFFLGRPQLGLIYKINSEGKVKSLTWIQPFEHTSSTPKHFHALLKDFHSTESPLL